MQKRLLIFLLLLNTLSLFGQSTYKQNIADLVSITFPKKPTISDTLGHKVVQFVDSIAIYSVLNTELDQDKLLFSKDKLPEFYDSMADGYVDASKGKLINKKLFEIDGLKGIEMEMVATANPNLPDLRFVKMIVLNNTLITVNFLTSSQNRQLSESARTQFFNSLTVTADKTTIQQGSDPSAYFIGYMIGKYLVWATLLGGLAVFILLIRRFTRKRKAAFKTGF